MASALLGFLLRVSLADRSALAMAVSPLPVLGGLWLWLLLLVPVKSAAGGGGAGFTVIVGPLDGLLTLPVSQTVCCAKCVVGTAWEPMSGGGWAARALSGHCAQGLLLVCLSSFLMFLHGKTALFL